MKKLIVFKTRIIHPKVPMWFEYLETDKIGRKTLYLCSKPPYGKTYRFRLSVSMMSLMVDLCHLFARGNIYSSIQDRFRLYNQKLWKDKISEEYYNKFVLKRRFPTCFLGTTYQYIKDPKIHSALCPVCSFYEKCQLRTTFKVFNNGDR